MFLRVADHIVPVWQRLIASLASLKALWMRGHSRNAGRLARSETTHFDAKKVITGLVTQGKFVRP